MKTCISIPFIHLLLCFCAFSGFSPLYGEESCGLTSDKVTEKAATKVQTTITYRLPINYKVGFYNYYKHAPYNKYFGCLRSDGAVFLMTFNDTATQVQFQPYDPVNKPQTMHADTVKVDNTIKLSFFNKTGDKAALGTEGKLVSSIGDRARYLVYKCDVGYVE